MYDAMAAIRMAHKNLNKTLGGYEDSDALTMDIACGLYDMFYNLVGNIIDDYYGYYGPEGEEVDE